MKINCILKSFKLSLAFVRKKLAMKIKQFITQNGIKPDYSDVLKRHIEITNFISVLYIIFTIPFIIINLDAPEVLPIRSLPIFAGLISFLLIRFHFHKLGRFFLSISFPILIYLMGAFIFIDDGTNGMAPKFWIIGSAAIPFLVFTYEERAYIIAVLLTDIFLYLSFDKANEMLNLSFITENLDRPQMRVIAGLGALVMVSAVTFYVKKQLYKRNSQLAEQAKRLHEANQELIAAEEELKQNNEELLTLNEKQKEQNEIIKRSLEDINASISYAKTIQKALIQPTTEVLEKNFEEYFILFEPKDKVSGDFYFFEELDDKIVIAVGDATGHGVPGAMMSMLGITLVHEYVHHPGLTPAQVLDKIRKNVISSLNQEESQNRDGFDLALVYYYPESKKMVFAGASMSILLARKGEITTLKGNNMPLGMYVRNDGFNDITSELKKGDILYLYTDGFRDQFGGKYYKKFGSKNFLNVIAQINDLPLDQQFFVLKEVLEDWKAGHKQTDDITVIGIKI